LALLLIIVTLLFVFVIIFEPILLRHARVYRAIAINSAGAIIPVAIYILGVFFLLSSWFLARGCAFADESVEIALTVVVIIIVGI